MSTLLPASPRRSSNWTEDEDAREGVSSSTQARSRGEEKFCTVRGGRLGMQARGSATHGVFRHVLEFATVCNAGRFSGELSWEVGHLTDKLVTLCLRQDS